MSVLALSHAKNGQNVHLQKSQLLLRLQNGEDLAASRVLKVLTDNSPLIVVIQS